MSVQVRGIVGPKKDTNNHALLVPQHPKYCYNGTNMKGKNK